MNFCDTLGLLGLFVGILSVAYSFWSYKKMKTAQEAEKEIERKFMHYMAAKEFEALGDQAIAIMANVGRRDWGQCSELGRKISFAFGQARGARVRLLETLEKDKLDGAGVELQSFMASLPVTAENAEVPVQQIQVMISQCQALVNIAGELVGRLSVESILRPEGKNERDS